MFAGFKHKLQMMGFTREGPVLMHGHNQSASCNTTVPDSTLKMKHQIIVCHLVREGVTRDEWRTAYGNDDENESDLLTKTLPNREKRKNFLRMFFHHASEVMNAGM